MRGVCVAALTAQRLIGPVHSTTPTWSSAAPMATGSSDHEANPASRSVDRPGQTRREAGTQSQGSFLGETARLPTGSVDPIGSKESIVKANLARFTWALTLLASWPSPSAPGCGGASRMTRYFKAQAFRVLLVLSALASSALVIEAGQRWHTDDSPGGSTAAALEAAGQPAASVVSPPGLVARSPVARRLRGPPGLTGRAFGRPSWVCSIGRIAATSPSRSRGRPARPDAPRTDRARRRFAPRSSSLAPRRA